MKQQVRLCGLTPVCQRALQSRVHVYFLCIIAVYTYSFFSFFTLKQCVDYENFVVDKNLYVGFLSGSIYQHFTYLQTAACFLVYKCQKS